MRDFLVVAKDKDSIYHQLLRQAKASEDDIYWDMCFFLFAGHDTTSFGLLKCIFELTKSPERKSKIFDEIKSHVSENFEDLGSVLNSDKIE
jgi:cytochrome P450